MPVLAGAGLAWQLLDGPAYASTGVGEQRRFSPVPGLLVTLNTSSRIGWERQDGYCRVWLEQGEAALAIDGIDLRHAVFHCGERTFLLGAGEYNVRRDDSASSQVLILSGTARLARQAASARRITAGRGERIAFSPAIVKVELAPANAVQAASAWPQGEVVFDGETLGEAIAEYNRYLDRKLVIKDPGVKTMRIGGRFETLRPASFVAAIEKSFGLRALEQPDRILIERKSPVG